MSTRGLIITTEELNRAYDSLERARLDWTIWNAFEVFSGSTNDVEIEVPTNQFEDLKRVLGTNHESDTKRMEQSAVRHRPMVDPPTV